MTIDSPMPNDVLPTSLLSKMRAATAHATEYLLSRQTDAGGFCFYRCDYLDDANLLDTYHAIAALTLLGEQMPRVDAVVQFLAHVAPLELNALYYCTGSLDLLGHAASIDADWIQRIRQMRITSFPAKKSGAFGGWLASTRRILRMQRRFAQLQQDDRIVRFIEAQRIDGGYGDKPNLCDTYLCLSILDLLTTRIARDDTQAFVDSLQVPSFGFTATRDSQLANLDVIQAGTKSCALLGIPIRYRTDVLESVLACQTSNGGFSRSSGALPNVEQTHRALQILTLG